MAIMWPLFGTIARFEMTLLSVATFIAFVLIFPSHHVFMEEGEVAHRNDNPLPDLEKEEYIDQNGISHRIKKRNADTSSDMTTLPPTTRISISTTLPETGRQKTEITNPSTVIIIIMIIIIKVLHFWGIFAI